MKVICMRQCMEPIRILTVNQFAESSATTAKRYDAAAAQGFVSAKLHVHRFPLQAAADLTLVHEFRNRADALLTSSSLWDDLVGDKDKSIELNAFVFKLLSSLESGVEELHSEANQQSPICMFRSDANADWAKEVTELPSCRVVQWHREHVRDAEQHGGLLAAIPRAKREHIILEAAMDIKRLASLHAAFRRRTRMLGQQTHSVDWEMMVATWVTDRTRIARELIAAIQKSYIDDHVVQSATQCSTGSASASNRGRKRKSQNSPDEKKPQRRRKAPGKFRIFSRDLYLRCDLQGKERPCMATASKKYWALSADEHAKLAERAARAKSQNKALGGTKRVLGLDTKETLRFAKKAQTQRMAATLQMQQHDAEVNALTPYGESRKIAQVALQASSQAQHGATDLQVAADDYYICKQAATLVVRQAREESELAIATWHQVHGRNNVQSLGRSLLLPESMTNNMIAMLGCCLPSYFLCRDTEHIKSCCKVIASKVFVSNLKKALADQFRRRCHPIMDKDIERIQDMAEDKPRRPCLKMLVCLCDAQGEQHLVSYPQIVLCSLSSGYE